MNYCRLMGELPLSNNTSTERGWLTPTSGDPDYDEALDRLLSRWMRNVSGLPAGMVRQRWQKEQPSLPSVETNWCAFGVTGWPIDNSPAFTNQTDEGAQLWRHETFECMASFYGPAGMSYASRFRDGISVPQNNAELNALGLSLGDYTGLTPNLSTSNGFAATTRRCACAGRLCASTVLNRWWKRQSPFLENKL